MAYNNCQTNKETEYRDVNRNDSGILFFHLENAKTDKERRAQRKAKAIELAGRGFKQDDIAALLGVSRDTVSKDLEFSDFGKLDHVSKRGRI
jgi:hypothetical protein